MHRIIFRLWLCPRPHYGDYSTPQTPISGFKGTYFLGKKRERREGRRPLYFFLRIYYAYGYMFAVRQCKLLKRQSGLEAKISALHGFQNF